MPFKILYTADLHGNEIYYRKLLKEAKELEIKAVVLGGDLCPRGKGALDFVIKLQKDFFEKFFISEFKKIKKDVFVIMGNDDFRINEPILQNQSGNIKENSNIKYINKKRSNIYTRNIVGYSFVNPTPFRLKDWEKYDDNEKELPIQVFDEEIRTIDAAKGTIIEDMETFKKLSNPQKTIYVIHAPPFNTKLDITSNKEHVGSKSVRQFIENEQPLLTLHGHIHESPKMSGSFVDRIGKTICINVGSSYPEDKLNCVVVDIDNLDVKYIEI